MFVGANFLVTVHYGPIKELDEAEKRWKRHKDQFDHGIGVLLYSILDAIVDNYFPAVDRLVDESEELETRIFEGGAGQRNLTEKLLSLKNLFLQLRRIAGPERDVLNVLTNRDSPVFDERTLVYFRDVYDHITRVTDTLDLYRDQISSAMDANLTVVSNDLNKVMRTLTAASIILMANSMVTGIYGMNFENMPELKWQYGYFVVLVLMVTITTSLFIFFKRLKWF
jgi:magnesium transporter